MGEPITERRVEILERGSIPESGREDASCLPDDRVRTVLLGLETGDVLRQNLEYVGASGDDRGDRRGGKRATERTEFGKYSLRIG